MFKKIFIIPFLLIVAIAPSIIAKQVDIQVNGMVCEFCATTIEKNLRKKKDIVKDVLIDFDNRLVSVVFKEEKNLSDEQLTDIITDNGYNVEKITR